ncbi:hypothetical protein PIB30_080346, partial [Stylosanthes scabra]|nr:hypothetical protein [Stylosanthes scabra]
MEPQFYARMPRVKIRELRDEYPRFEFHLMDVCRNDVTQDIKSFDLISSDHTVVPVDFSDAAIDASPDGISFPFRHHRPFLFAPPFVASNPQAEPPVT